jgi:membrane protein implicated in regulation of membrane protease activity
VALAWVAVCVVLVAIELNHFAFYAVFAAAGAACAALVAVFAPSAVVTQVLVAAVVAIVGVQFGRPYVSRVLEIRGPHFKVRGVHGGLIGAHAVTLDTITANGGGHIRLLGETWLAVAGGHHTIAPDTPVVVTAVVGTTLTVVPAS